MISIIIKVEVEVISLSLRLFGYQPSPRPWSFWILQKRKNSHDSHAFASSLTITVHPVNFMKPIRERYSYSIKGSEGFCF